MGDEVTSGQIARAEGVAGSIRLALLGLTYRVGKHGKVWPYSDFGSDLIVALHEQIPKPSRRGLLVQTVVCRSCREPLPPGEASVRFLLDMPLKNAPQLRVEVSGPGFHCPRCGAEQIEVTTQRSVELSDAIIAAFRSVGIEPD